MNGILLHTTAGNRHLRLDPRTKLILLLSVSFTLMWAGTTGVMAVVRPLLAFLPCILLLFSIRWKTGVFGVILSAFCFAAEQTLVYTTAGLLNIILVPVCAICTRFLPCVFAGYYLMATTTVSELTAGMERMRLSQKLIIPLSVMFRFFPTVLEAYRSIRDAMRMRSIGLSSPIVALEYRVVPLIASVVKIGEELSAAALTRGLGGNDKRTNMCEIGFGLIDGMILVIAVGGAAVFLMYKAGIV